jgi:hypothetical protein
MKSEGFPEGQVKISQFSGAQKSKIIMWKKAAILVMK